MATINKFSGLMNTVDPKSMPVNALVVAENVNISKTNLISRRQGYAKSIEGTSITASYVTRDRSRFYIVDNGSLKLINIDGSTVTLADGLTSKPIYWDDQSNYVALSCGLLINPDQSVVKLNIPEPKEPKVTIASGNLKAGQYQIATALKDSSGREGTTSGIVITEDVTEGQGLLIEPVVESGFTSVIYISELNGDCLYRLVETNEPFLVADQINLSYPIDINQVISSAMPDNVEHIAFYESKLFVSTFNSGHSFVFFSQEYWWHLFQQLSDYLTIVGKIVSMRSTKAGLIIGTDSQIWLYANESMTKLADYGLVNGESITEDETGSIWLWTKRGIATIDANGFKNITEATYSFKPGSHVTTSIVKDDGQQRLIVLSDDTGQAYNQF